VKIEIEKVENGWVVRSGGKTYVATTSWQSISEAIKKLMDLTEKRSEKTPLK
jgi:hypothetical protein